VLPLGLAGNDPAAGVSFDGSGSVTVTAAQEAATEAAVAVESAAIRLARRAAGTCGGEGRV